MCGIRETEVDLNHYDCTNSIADTRLRTLATNNSTYLCLTSFPPFSPSLSGLHWPLWRSLHTALPRPLLLC